MSWIQRLYETYESCFGNRTIPDSDNLCPVGYSVQSAHVNVVLDIHGNFRRASLVQKENAKTLIPVTEKSLTGRTSGIAPHALCDSLQYCAGDYKKFGGKRDSYYPQFIEQLGKWAESKYCHNKVVAIYRYLQKEQIVKDLIDSKILSQSDGILSVESRSTKDDKEPDPIMKLLTFDDKGLKDQAKVFVRWVVEGDCEVNSNTWEDPTLIETWREYVDSQDSKVGFCYVGGEEAVVAQKHPSRLRNGKDGAKLISSNDISGYTFRGRFLSVDQAAEVSLEVTQKAHSALRWLIGRKQAFRSDTQTFISWTVRGKEIPALCVNSLEFLGDQEENDLGKLLAIGDVGQAFAQRLNKKIAGYKANIDDSDGIVVMGLDSATPGRMAITYYRELTGSDFLHRIEQWHSDFAWYQFFGKEHQFFGAPAPKDIAWAAFGKKVEGKNGSKLLNATVERILPCIVDGAPLPNDLVVSSVRRASNRIGLEPWEWEKCLGIACALFKGTHRKGRDEMALETERRSKDYLYGRLLAVADRIEATALAYAKENRDTTASRLMQRFSDRPFSAWKNIHDALVPYEARIRSRAPGLLLGYKELLEEIHDAFRDNDFNSDNRLSGEYLLGYYCQRKWLRDHKRKDGQWVRKTIDEPDIQASDVEEEK